MLGFWQVAELSVDSVLCSLASAQAKLSAPSEPSQAQISIFEPSSTTELLGNFKKSAAPLAL